MQKKPLVKLINDLEQEMLRLGYANSSMRVYRNRWRMLLKFARERGEKFYSERLGMDFIEKHFHILEDNFKRPISRSEVSELRIIRMIGDFQLHHTILQWFSKRKKIQNEPCFFAINNQFKSHCISKGYSKTTIDYYVNQSARFIDFLVSQDIKNCKEINLEVIYAYIKTLSGYSHETITHYIYSMRVFLRFLLEKGKVKVDFTKKIPTILVRKQSHIPSVWTKSELKKMIEAIDRGSPKGKRDYAIILLACFLGMRSIDIKSLKIENFHWEEKKLVFTQSKTKTPLSLPLTKDVGWAVIDYLKYGRPKTDSPYLFVRHIAPFVPFSKDQHLYQLIKRYIDLAHLPTLRKRRGMHSLRHTLASMLLEEDTPLSTITDILGHVDVDSTAIYLKVDIKKLKECSISFEEKKDEKHNL